MQMDVGQLNSSSSDPRDLLKKFQLILQNPVLLKHHHRGDSPESSSCSVNFRPSRVDLDIRIPEDHQDLVSDDSPHRDTRPPEDHLLCPRCESTNTKFCYFNNYNLTQPRYFCKTCRRYWTRGGALRRVPVGGGVRRYSNKRARTTKTPSGVTTKSHQMVTASGSVMS